MTTIRKNKGDSTFYLTFNDGVYRLVKKRKAYAKDILKEGKKTTKILLCDFTFTKDRLNDINFESNQLRIQDKEIIKNMITEYETKEITKND